MSVGAAAYADDGLFRYVVTNVVETAGGTGGSDAPSHALDRSDVADVPEGSTLVRRRGVMGYLDSSGGFVPLAAVNAAVVSVDDLLEAAGVESVTRISDGTYAVVTSVPGALDSLGVDALIDPPFGFAQDPYEPYQWALDNTGSNLSSVDISPAPVQLVDADVDGAEARAASTGAGIVVAVVDSGVDFSHPELAGAVWTNAGEVCGNGADDDANGFVDDCQGWDFGYEDNQPYATANSEHGTHVAGIIAAASGNGTGVAGLAPGVQIMDLSVQGPAGISGSSIARAIRYAVDNGADVINLSLGSEPGTPLAAVTPMVEAVQHANAHNVVVVAAAGNHGVDLALSPVYPASIDAPNVLAVGASTPSEAMAPFSNHGQTVDLFAPGELILSTMPGGGYAFMSGTSQASPVAAAAAALVRGADPAADPAAVISRLVGTADESPAYVGLAGNPVRLNAARAVGLEPDAGGAAGLVTISGLAAASLDSVDAQISLHNPGGQFNQPFHWEASVIAVRDDGVFGIIGHPVEVGGASLTTDDRGAVRLAESDATAADLHIVLPTGRYALVVEAVPRTDSTVRLGEAYISTFTVGDPAGDQGSTPGAGGPPVGGGGAEPVDGGSLPLPDGSGSPEQPPVDPGQVGSGEGAVGGSTTVATTVPAGGDSGTPGDLGTGDQTDVPSVAPPGDGVTQDPAVDDPGSEPLPAGEAPVVGQPVDPEPPAGTDEPVSTTTVPIDVVDGGWAINGISPRSGPVMSETLVTISGVFPEAAFVWFGDQAGTVVAQIEGVLLVATPLRAEPGPVDVVLRTGDDAIVLEAADGFLFVADGDAATGDGGGSQPPDGGADQPATGDPGTGVPEDGPVDQPSSGTSDPVGGGDGPSVTIDPVDTVDVPDASGGGGRNGNGPNPQRQARAAIMGDPVDLGNGLTGRPLAGLEAIGGVPACHSDPCRTRRISG
jgi:subtilisin family serine protease